MTKFSLIIFCVALLPVSSCHHNRLKTDEQKLVMELQEKLEADSARTIKARNQTSGILKLKEQRSSDRNDPPVIIDIKGNLENVKEMNLTDIASDVRYIRLEQVPDTAIPGDLKFKYAMLDDFIVAFNLYGTHLYSQDGKYLRSIVKNELTNVTVKPGMMIFRTDFTWVGSRYSVQSKGNSIYYNYLDNITGQNYIMKYDCSTYGLSTSYKYDPENPGQISGLGEVAVDLNHGNVIPQPARSHQGMFSAPPETFFMDMGAFMLNDESYLTFGHDNLMTVKSTSGDTITDFSRYEKLVNYTKSLKRGTDSGVNYEIAGTLYCRPAFNDTVFRIEPPNRMIPVYVLDLGSYKTTMQEGVDPGFDLNGRIIPQEWAETQDFIFLTFDKDNYDCPANRKNKSVKIYHAVYSKKNHSLIIVKGDPYDYTPEILSNDIDGGVPVWPLAYMIGKEGEVLMPLKGEELKSRVKSDSFRKSGAPEDAKRQLQKLADAVNSGDDILMIIK